MSSHPRVERTGGLAGPRVSRADLPAVAAWRGRVGVRVPVFASLLHLLFLAGGHAGAADFVPLKEAWRMALEDGFAIASAQDAVRAADIQKLQARSQFFPKVTPSYFRGPNDRGFSVAASQTLPWLGGEVRADYTARTFEGIQTPAARARETSITVSQPLLRSLGPNASLYDLRNARRAHEAQERNLHLGKQRYLVEVTRAYYQVLAQRELLSVAQKSAARSEGLRKASEARLDVGLSNKLDVYRAQLSESQAEQSIVQAETSLQAALEAFRFLLGRGPDDVAEPAPEEIPDPTAEELEPIEDLVALGLERRLDLLEAREQIDDARRTAALSRQNLMPDMSLNVRFSETRGAGPSGPFATINRRWESFVSGSLPLERAADFARLQLSNLDVAARERNYRQRLFEVEAEVRAAHRNLISLSRSINTQKGAVDIAEQQLRLANLRYQRGLASNFDVVDAEGSLLAARSSLVQLLATWQVARLDLDRVVGRLNTNLEIAP